MKPLQSLLAAAVLLILATPRPAAAQTCNTTECQRLSQGLTTGATEWYGAPTTWEEVQADRAEARAAAGDDSPPFPELVLSPGCEWVEEPVREMSFPYYANRRSLGRAGGPVYDFRTRAAGDLRVGASGNLEVAVRLGKTELFRDTPFSFNPWPVFQYFTFFTRATLGQQIVLVTFFEREVDETAAFVVRREARTLLCEGVPLISQSRQEVREVLTRDDRLIVSVARQDRDASGALVFGLSAGILTGRIAEATEQRRLGPDGELDAAAFDAAFESVSWGRPAPRPVALEPARVP